MYAEVILVFLWNEDMIAIRTTQRERAVEYVSFVKTFDTDFAKILYSKLLACCELGYTKKRGTLFFA